VENWNEPTIVVVVIFNCIIIYPIRVSDSENNAVSKKKCHVTLFSFCLIELCRSFPIS